MNANATSTTETAAEIHAVAAAIDALRRRTRGWLEGDAGMTAEEARAALVYGFPSAEAILASKLDHAQAVATEFESALADARARLAASPPPLRDTPAPRDLAELKQREVEELAARDVAHARMELTKAVEQAGPLEPLLQAGVPRFAGVLIAAWRDLVAERQAAEVARIEAGLAELRNEQHALRELAGRWGVTVPELPRVPGLTAGR